MCSSDLQELGNLAAHALVAPLVVGLAFLLFLALFLALLEVACHFDDDLAGMTVALEQRVDHRLVRRHPVQRQQREQQPVDDAAAEPDRIPVARHAARIFAKETKLTEDEALERIRAMFDAEMDAPTDPGESRVVNIRFECYRSPQFGVRPQITGEAYEYPPP